MSTPIKGIKIGNEVHKIDYESLENKPDHTQFVNITIPSGRMRGDVDGDGRITSADNDIIVNHIQGREYITDSTALLAADFDNSGVIDNSDLTRCTRIIKGSKKVGDYSLDILGHWLVNPNYSTEEMQFYTDIEVPGMSASSSAVVSVKGSYEQDFFRAECIDGAIRIYAKLCPISEIKAIVQFSSGDGSAVVICECTEPSNISRFVNITIPAGRMRGDINGDGKFTKEDSTILLRHNAKIEYITDELQLLCADVNNDGSIDALDNGKLNSLVKGTAKVGGISSDVMNNWIVNPNYATEEAQFYTDIAISDMTVNSSAVVSVKGSYEQDFFRAECIDGAIRIYAKLCPISELKAVVQFSSGDGSAIVTCEDNCVAEKQNKINMQKVTLLASGWASDDEYGIWQMVTVDGVSDDETEQIITPSPSMRSLSAYTDAGIVCNYQEENSLSFLAQELPTVDIDVYVTIADVNFIS